MSQATFATMWQVLDSTTTFTNDLFRTSSLKIFQFPALVNPNADI